MQKPDEDNARLKELSIYKIETNPSFLNALLVTAWICLWKDKSVKNYI